MGKASGPYAFYGVARGHNVGVFGSWYCSPLFCSLPGKYAASQWKGFRLLSSRDFIHGRRRSISLPGTHYQSFGGRHSNLRMPAMRLQRIMAIRRPPETQIWWTTNGSNLRREDHSPKSPLTFPTPPRPFPQGKAQQMHLYL